MPDRRPEPDLAKGEEGVGGNETFAGRGEVKMDQAAAPGKVAGVGWRPAMAVELLDKS